MDTEVKTTVDEEEVETVATDDEATAEEEENEGTLAEASADDEGENISDEDLDTFLERYNASREQNGEDEAEEEAAAEQQGDAETETAGEEDPDISASLAADLAAIKAKYPDCAPDSMDQITDLTEFIRLRVRGMSAEDAFAKVDAEKIERVKKLQKAANADATAVRIIPVPGKTVGDSVSFGGLLGEAPIMPVKPYGAEAFIDRGGRIPAPLQSLKN